jgi:hypothetical protein
MEANLGNYDQKYGRSLQRKMNKLLEDLVGIPEVSTMTMSHCYKTWGNNYVITYTATVMQRDPETKEYLVNQSWTVWATKECKSENVKVYEDLASTVNKIVSTYENSKFS